MSLISQIDALPDDMKVLCGSFAYGLKETRGWGCWNVRVGADVYRIESSESRHVRESNIMCVMLLDRVELGDEVEQRSTDDECYEGEEEDDED